MAALGLTLQTVGMTMQTGLQQEIQMVNLELENTI
jgi:hypothetical protein